MAKIVKEQDVQEYVKDLRAKFYGALEDVLIAVIQYATRMEKTAAYWVTECW